jgi:deoxyribose-phosphate aldolase
VLKEILIKDVSITKEDLCKKIFEFYSYEVDNICIHLHHLKFLDNIETINVIPVLDFPNGLSDVKQKAKEIKSIEFYKYDQLDYCVNNFLLSNNLIKELENEIKVLKQISTCGNVRPIIEYSTLYDYKVVEVFLKVCRDQGIETIILSTTEKADSILDDRIFCVMVQNYGINCIVSNKYFNQEKLQKIKESKPYGVRSLSISSFSDLVYNPK